MSLPDRSQQPRTLITMEDPEKPNRRQVLLAMGITFLLLMITGARAFGVITSNLQPVMDEETFTAVSGHQIQKRETNDTVMDNPEDVNSILLLADQKSKRMEDAQLKLNNGKIPIQVWVSDIATVSFFTNLGGLEEDFNEALALLDTAYFSVQYGSMC